MFGKGIYFADMVSKSDKGSDSLLRRVRSVNYSMTQSNKIEVKFKKVNSMTIRLCLDAVWRRQLRGVNAPIG